MINRYDRSAREQNLGQLIYQLGPDTKKLERKEKKKKVDKKEKFSGL